MKTLFALCLAVSLSTQVYAVDLMFAGFDVATQKMVSVLRSDEPLYAPTVDVSQTGAGWIDFANIEWLSMDAPGGGYEYWCAIPLDPVDRFNRTDVDSGQTNQISIEVFDADYPVGQTQDLLIVDVNDDGISYYTYPAFVQGDCVPVLPDSIRINSAFCATICHGSYTIPIECEDPNYTPGQLQITVTNGCHYDPPIGHCDNDTCPTIDWTLFAYNLRVFANCRLFLTMSYCGMDPGCICIWRSDFRLNAEVTNFAALPGDGSVRVNWSTASETDNASFRISRSEVRDGIYVTVHQTAGAGTSSDLRSYEWVDNTAQNGHTYYYKLNTVDMTGQAHTYETIAEATPLAGNATVVEFRLSQNFPNPFNSETSFSFSIPADDHVSLKVFDLLGREVGTVVDQNMSSGSYKYNWSAKNLATGVYMYTLTSGQNSESKKLLFLK
jgi:hypothetical protein